MNEIPDLTSSVLDGWHNYQTIAVAAIAPLDADQLALRAAPQLRTVGQIAAHMVGARARWFHGVMGEGGDEFKALARWDRRGAKPRSADELVSGLETTWKGMHAATGRWSSEDWQMTWPGEVGEPEVLTRQWIIWHLIEHDVHHGGEISITLGAHGVRALAL